MSEMIFRKIKKGNVFCSKFENLTQNNKIEFSDKGIAVVYGANGAGKTSLSKIFNSEKDTILEGTYDDNEIVRGETGNFHVIEDQNARNIIKGETEDFLLGDNIRQERALKKELDGISNNLYSELIAGLKENFNITKSTSRLIDIIEDVKLSEYISDLSNAKSKGKKIVHEDFINKIDNINVGSSYDYDEKFKFLIKTYDSKKSIISEVLKITNESIVVNKDIKIIEENDTAISVLKKYDYKNECIVCDNKDFERELLLNNKEASKESIIASLDEGTKKILNDIISEIKDEDPFNIKQILTKVVETGEFNEMNILKEELQNKI